MHRESLDEVTLADEWSFVRSYLEIESLRLEERLRLHLEADPEVLQSVVPPFVLQPLVENAIQHAVAPRKTGGRVEVTARRRSSHLELEVCDDGPGMPPAIPASGAGLGLRLLRERLALLYAGHANLTLEPVEGGGVRATISLPLDRETLSEPA
jgi:two-component system sensor histidine kinase AlgZ